MPIFKRHQNPPRRANYLDYKPFLRKDFEYRCAYCLLHEGHSMVGGFHNFTIDHFRPKELFPEKQNDYENCYYACGLCNRAKWKTWPSTQEMERGYRFVDPCEEDLYSEHGRVNARTGILEWLTKPGEYSIRVIRLNRKIFVAFRIERFDAQREINRCLDRISELEAQTGGIAAELMSELRSKIRALEEKFVNPKVPYEREHLQDHPAP